LLVSVSNLLSQHQFGVARGFPSLFVQAWIKPTRAGELMVGVPWLTEGYGVQAASDDLWRSGWLHTQDMAEIDADGGIRTVDRIV
jgi:fatty-acyl-CoA synthase